jgi:catechol 2,3-dioxygenase-like lactoylglutathione lyase family enzyme
MSEFKIEGLDHVAIRVKDMERSATWYEEVIGLRRLIPENGMNHQYYY